MSRERIRRRREARTSRILYRRKREAGQCFKCTKPAERNGACIEHAALATVSSALRRPTIRGRVLPRGKVRPAVRLLLAGERVSDVATSLGIQPGMVTLIRRTAKLPAQGRGRRRDHVVTMLAGKIRQLRDQGKTIAEVADYLGISINRVKKTLAARRS